MDGMTKHEKRVAKVAMKKKMRLAKAERRERIEKIKKLALPAAGIAAIILIAFFVVGYAGSLGNAPSLEPSPDSFNFGNVSQSGGKVSTTFTISNKGKEELVINNIVTSCMCTSAVLESDGEKSPVFGMHSNYPGWSQKISPGESVKLEVFYDPNVHKELRGGVTRIVSIFSNDPLFARKDIKITVFQTD